MSRQKRLGIVAIAIAVMALLPVLNTVVQKGYLGNAPRWWAQFLIPKENLYDLLLEAPIDVRESGRVFEYQVQHRYAGTHTFGVLASKEIPMRMDYIARTLELDIVCVADGRPAFRTTKHLSPWWGHQNGFAVAVYKVPRDLPLNKPARCRVTVVRADEEFDDRFYPRLFYARKSSEE